MTWAGRVLAAVAQEWGLTPEIDAALELAGDREQWHRGSEVFGVVRGRPFTGEEQLSAEQELLFRIAEIVAKIAYNAAGPPPYYDYHAGWRIGPLARRIAEATQDPAARDRIEAALGPAD